MLRVVWPTAETGFDPARVSDLYSNVVTEAIFERLLSYDYLARPAKLVPETAEAMPDVTDNGRTYTFRIRKGIYFTPDPAFKGKRRELTADDYVYSFKRFVDPKNKSPWAFLLQGKVEGFDELYEAAKRHGQLDYNARVAGLQALDRYTLRIRLKQSDYVFLYTMAHSPFGAVAREVVEAYPDDLMAHPVGTGPYTLKEWRRANKIILEANPDYRGKTWNYAVSEPSWDDALAASMLGKKLPQIGRVEINVIEEEQSRWLAFNQKELDYMALPGTFRPEVIGPDKQLNKEWASKGVSLFRTIDPDIVYAFFNFRDPLVGGFSKEKIALRRAIIMAYDHEEELRVIRKGQAVRAIMPIPYGVVGHDPNWKPLNNYDPVLANKLLDYFNYKKGKDGYRSAARRQAPGDPARHRDFRDRPRIQRAVEEEHGCDRRPDRVPARQVRRTPEGREVVPADDVAGRVERRLSGWRELHAAAVRAQHRTEQQRVLRVEAVRRVLPEDARTSRFAGAKPPVPRNDQADGSGRRVAAAGVPRAQPADLAVGQRLQEAPDPERRVHLYGHRSRHGRVPPSRHTMMPIASFRRIAACLAALALSGVAIAAPDPAKVIRDVFPVAETGFDPAAVHDLYSGTVVQALHETLFTYDYLAQPAKIIPLTAEAMPQIQDEGRTWIVKLKKGILFSADAAFKGKPRASSWLRTIVYSLKRLADPKIRSPWAFLVEGKFQGLDELTDEAKKSGRFDYDRKIAGMEALDRYTIRFRLKATDYNLPYVLAHEPTSAVAREVIEAYAGTDGRASANPVGTGPYRLEQWVRSSKIVLTANPVYRGFAWNFTSTDNADLKIIAQMKGKRMPQIGRVEISIMEEDQSRLLAFQNGELDIMNLEGPLAPKVLDGDKLRPEFARKGVQLSRIIDPELSYLYWNMQDPVVGGLSKEKIALRRAMAMAYPVDEDIKVARNGQAVEAKYPIPPGVVGHQPHWRPSIRFDPVGANALLDKFGYKKGPDGFRTLPDGKPLVVKHSSRPGHGRTAARRARQEVDGHDRRASRVPQATSSPSS